LRDPSKSVALYKRRAFSNSCAAGSERHASETNRAADFESFNILMILNLLDDIALATVSGGAKMSAG
jgi:hypothetical protein